MRDYIESAAGRGRAAPGAVKTSLSTWAESLGINWPLANPIVCAAAHVDSDETPKHAPPMKLDTVKKSDELALNVEAAPPRRAFAAGVLSMAFTSLRFSDAQRLRSFEMNDDSAYGTLPQSKTKRPHGLPWPRAFPLAGVAGSNKWALPIFDFRRAHAKTNGPIPSFAPPCLDRKWELEKAGPSA